MLAAESQHELPRILALPREVRDAIWDYAFEPPVDSNATEDQFKIHSQNVRGIAPLTPGHLDWGREPMTRLLRVNHQVYDEVMPILYQRLTFTFDTFHLPADFEQFLDLLGPRTCERIRSSILKSRSASRMARCTAWPGTLTCFERSWQE